MRDIGILLAFLVVIFIAIISTNKPKDVGNIPISNTKTELVEFRGSDGVRDYIIKFQDIAIKDMDEFGIPASIKMAQAILESGYGSSTLTKKSNNHFGIKCKRKKCKHRYCINMCDDSCDDYFRSYSTPEESFIAHSVLLSDPNHRYYVLIGECGNDFRCWANGLKRRGYATSKTYNKKLIKLIEDYNLHILDEKKRFI